MLWRVLHEAGRVALPSACWAGHVRGLATVPVRVKSLPQRISECVDGGAEGDAVTVLGWVRSVRAQKNTTFVELNDGSSIRGCQAVVQGAGAQGLTTGACVRASGKLVASPGARQAKEIQCEQIEVLGACDSSYPLQKKRHTFEFLREIGHLRPRTNTQGAVLRARNAIAMGVHDFFQSNGFLQVHTPIITANDCEGAGELFRVGVTRPPEGGGEFFGRPVFLTVSGQLHAEIVASAMGRVYTFGPTFRAEHSHTARHLAEFQMIEGEIAFVDSRGAMDVAEECIRHAAGVYAARCSDDIAFFTERISLSLRDCMASLQRPFARISYRDAIAQLQSHADAEAAKGRRAFECAVSWGIDLSTEHERFIAESVVKGPAFITDYPRDIKPFYMRDNGDGTVASFDLVVPAIGELVGGSAREDRLDVLLARLSQLGSDAARDLAWYADLRRYGSFPHAGFGIGFERLVRLLTGVENIRDVTPFPRYPGSCPY